MTRQRVWEILEVAKPGDTASSRFDIAISTLIIFNVLAVVVSTVPTLDAHYVHALHVFEIFSVVVFTIEYIARVWACAEDDRFQDGARGRFRYARTPLAIIDLLAILPFYLSALGVDMRVVRMFRLFRIFRLLKLVRYSRAMQLMGSAMRNQAEELVLAVFTMLILLLISSTLMYYAENAAQPEAFASIPDAVWWSVVTLTTVGYGDVYPVTALGKTLAGFIAIIGVGIVAMPAGIISSGLIQESRRRHDEHCPHCGKRLHHDH